MVKKEHRPTDKSVGRTFISPPGFNSTRFCAIAFQQVRLWAVVIEALIASTVKVIGTPAIAIEALLGRNSKNLSHYRNPPYLPRLTAFENDFRFCLIS
ncbi:hypothetical protein C5Y96_04710 [Blastopirellula marina]|uniref:Uncharacterized protein n=1 Tax=Blastopirellula marina TaxID=124 RepID=A0A2S8G3Y8_9BACT|nr:hypothetical protein C5Y96_04710 [Blastopirellula marina]RCS55476.1 hypothetical protein DTL36_04720 [Bremerella cremea]